MTRPKIFDDLAGVAGGALSALTGVRDEVEQLVRARVEEALRAMKLVRRDEFDATVELAANARAGLEDAALRIAALERRVGALEGHGLHDGGDTGAPGAEPPSAGAPSGGAPSGGASFAHPVTDHHMGEDGGLGGPPSAAA